MKHIALIIGMGVVSCVGLVSCSQEHAQTQAAHTTRAQTNPSQAPVGRAVHNETITRGSAAPAAPVQLTYQVPASIAANQPTTVDIAITTRLNAGAMRVEVAGHEGVTVLDDTQYRFDLGAVSERPITLQLKVLPADQAERFLAVLITVDTEMGAMARSFRIDLQPTPQAPTSESKRLIQQ